ncbi:MAG: hypothetical protein NVS3B14_17980 [Ktedonobacteraceae bacterium]
MQRGQKNEESLQWLAQEQKVRPEAELTTKKLEALLSVTDTALTHLALDDLLRELLKRVRVIMQVDNVAILLLAEDQQYLTARAVYGLEEEVASQVRIPIGCGFAGTIAARAEPLIIEHVASAEIVTPLLREQLQSLLGVPLLIDGRVIGVIHVGTRHTRRFSGDEIQLLQRVADRIALAIAQSNLHEAEQRARAEVVARASQLETIIDTMVDGVFLYDKQGKLVQANKAARTLLAIDRQPEHAGWSASERMERLQLRAGDGAPLSLDQMPTIRVLRGEVLKGVDILMQAPDGHDLRINVTGAPLYDANHQIIGGVMVARERVQREREEARANELALLESQRRMDDFLSVASHELRTPLTTIKGNVQLSKRELKYLADHATQADELDSKIDMIQELLERADGQVNFLNQLIGELLDASRISAHVLKLYVQLEPCNLVDIAWRAVQRQRRMLPKRVTRLDIPVAGKILVIGDAERIEQAITHYLSNALKFSAAECPVDISVCIEEKEALLAVRDEGPGLSPVEQERIWDQFYRAPDIKVQSGSSVGLGLGLYICRSIIELHHGQVGVTSAQGEGSTFWFTLPLAHEI